jgi:hypothetical protein
MDTLQTVAESIQPNDFGMLVDLTDCYLTLGLHPSQRKYCRFRHPANGRRFQWRTISFGMSEAPRICTKLLRPLMGLLKQLGIRWVLYIDDLLILHQDRTKLARGMAIAMNLLQSQMGLNLKTSKCCFRPSHQFLCLGFMWDTTAIMASVPRARLWETQRTARRLVKHEQRTAHTHARFGTHSGENHGHDPGHQGHTTVSAVHPAGTQQQPPYGGPDSRARPASPPAPWRPCAGGRETTLGSGTKPRLFPRPASYRAASRATPPQRLSAAVEP